MTTFLVWYKLIFIAPFAAAGLFALATIAGGFEAHGDGDHDVGGHDTDHDAPSDHNDSHSENSHQTAHSPWLHLASFLGVGAMPLTLLMMLYCLSWSVSGWCLLILVEEYLGNPESYAWIICAIAALVTITLVHIASKTLRRYIPKTETHVTQYLGMIGTPATTLYAMEGGAIGQIRFRDSSGLIHEARAQLTSNMDSLPADTNVFILDYDPEERIFTVGTEKSNTLCISANNPPEHPSSSVIKK